MKAPGECYSDPGKLPFCLGYLIVKVNGGAIEKQSDDCAAVCHLQTDCPDLGRQRLQLCKVRFRQMALIDARAGRSHVADKPRVLRNHSFPKQADQWAERFDLPPTIPRRRSAQRV